MEHIEGEQKGGRGKKWNRKEGNGETKKEITKGGKFEEGKESGQKSYETRTKEKDIKKEEKEREKEGLRQKKVMRARKTRNTTSKIKILTEKHRGGKMERGKLLKEMNMKKKE